MSDKKTPGQILRAARELRGYQQSNVAQQLRLSVQTIIDLENDDYKHFTASIYLRGHMRSFARVVNADLDEVFKAYDQMEVGLESDPQIPVLLADDVRVVRRPKNKIALWVGIGISVLLILMIILWWQEQRHHGNAIEVISLKSSQELTTSQASQSAPAKKLSKLPAKKKVTHNIKPFKPDYSLKPIKDS